jgi:hypothetical protein
MTQKKCSKCGCCKEETDYHWSSKRLNRRCSQCKSCRAVATRAYRKKYKTKRAIYDKQYYKKNITRYREWNHKRRSAICNCKDHFSSEQIEELMSFQFGLCFYCSTDIRYDYHIDHFVPLKLLNLSCPTCNCSKNGKLPTEFLETFGWSETLTKI